MDKSYVYFVANNNNSTLYVGVTSDLRKRIYKHKTHEKRGSFTDKYNCVKLVYFEEFGNIRDAIDREKQLKKWKRDWKNKLIESINPEWVDLMED